MQITYLGHQGWAFEGATGLILLDPVFDTIGNAGVQLPIWPDRALDPGKLPPISGLVISHEHSDHFDIDTLRRLPWRGDVSISDRTSDAMYRLLIELGYEPKRRTAYEDVVLDAITITFLPLRWSLLEPDPYGFLVRHADGTSFFTGVDGMPHPNTVKWLGKNCPDRTMDNFTNNYIEQLPELTGVVGPEAYATGRMVANMVEGVQELLPKRVVMSGQGWSYPPEYSELNHRFFNVTHEQLLPIMSGIYPDIEWIAPLPGTKISLANEPGDGEVADYSVLRPTTDRDYRGYTDALNGSPWSGEKELPPQAMESVREYVEHSFGQQLNAHAPKLMQRLFEYSTDHTRAAAVLPTVALRVLNGTSAEHYLLDQGWLRFTPAPQGLNIRTQVAGGVEIWASDLALLLEGREEPYLVYETAVRRWANIATLMGTLHVSFFLCFGPRLQPELYFDAYMRRLNELSTADTTQVKVNA